MSAVRHLSQGLPERLAQLTRWPVVVAGRRLFGDSDDPPQPDRPYQAHVSPGAGGKAPVPDRLGGAHGARARAGGRHGLAAAGPQRHRHARRLLCSLSRTRRLLRRAQPDPAPRSHQYRSRGHHRPLRAMDGRRQDRLDRSLGAHGDGGVPRANSRRRRHPTKHRRDACPPRSARDRAGARYRAARHRRLGGAAERQSLRRQDRHRSGLASARHRRALQRHRDELAPHAVRADGRHVPRARDAARFARVPAAHRRHHGLPLR